MTSTLTYSTILDVLSCGSCEIPFAMPSNLHKSRRADGGFFYCPNGHKISYHETENARLSKELERAKHWRDVAETRERAATDQAEAAQRSAAAYRGVATRLKNRAAAGVCPCCHRTFPELAAHMSSKHPEFITAEPGDTAVGLLPAPRNATCSRCGRESALNRDGTVRWHWTGPGRKNPCKGSHKQPVKVAGDA